MVRCIEVVAALAFAVALLVVLAAVAEEAELDRRLPCSTVSK